jgi:hypothetical protein
MRVYSLAFIGILAACPQAHAAKTVEWYLQHPAVRDKVYRLCQNNPGEAKHVPDCENAATAIERSAINRIPPVMSEAQICAQYPKWYRQTVLLHCPAD